MQAHNNLNVTAIMRDEKNGSKLNSVCTSINDPKIEVHIGRLQDVRPGIPLLDSADFLILDVDPKNGEDLSNIEDIINNRFPNKAVIATATDASVHDARRFIHMGAADFLLQPVGKTELISALEFASGRRKPTNDNPQSLGKIASFLGAAGGAGASALSVQMGCLMAEKRENENYNPCVLDFDTQFSSAALYLDLPSRTGLPDLINASERLDASLLRAAMCDHSSGLSILPASAELNFFHGFDEEFVASCLRLAAGEYGQVLVDLPALWTPWVVEILKKSDLIFLIIQQSIPHIHHARRQLEALKRNGLPSENVVLICNRFDGSWGKTVRLKDIEKSLGHKVEHCVANDFKLLSEAIDQGAQISQIKRRSKVQKDIDKIIAAEFALNEQRAERLEPHLEMQLAG